MIEDASPGSKGSTSYYKWCFPGWAGGPRRGPPHSNRLGARPVKPGALGSGGWRGWQGRGPGWQRQEA